MIHDSLEGARGQVEQGVVALLVGQVPPIFEDLFKGEAWAAPSELSPERHLGDILRISDHYGDSRFISLYYYWLLFFLHLAYLFLSFRVLSHLSLSFNRHRRV